MEILTLDQAAKYLNVSKSTLRRWDNEGKLVAIHLGNSKHRKYLKSDLDKLIGG